MINGHAVMIKLLIFYGKAIRGRKKAILLGVNKGAKKIVF